MFSYVSLEQQMHSEHPLLAVRQLTHTMLRSMSAEFDALYCARCDIDSSGHRLFSNLLFGCRLLMSTLWRQFAP
jgi:hypothetical protein